MKTVPFGPKIRDGTRKHGVRRSVKFFNLSEPVRRTYGQESLKLLSLHNKTSQHMGRTQWRTEGEDWGVQTPQIPVLSVLN